MHDPAPIDNAPIDPALIDTVLLAGTIHTMDAASPHAEALGIAGGRVVAVGPRRDAAGWAGAGVDTIDYGDAAIVPGLVDGHIHPVHGVSITDGTDLSAVTTLTELCSTLEAAAAEPGVEWVTGWGLDPNVFGGKSLHYREFEAALRGLPALVRLFDGHQAIASKRALELASVTGARTFDGKAEIVCDVHGEPTGLLNEIAAMDVVERLLPEIPLETRADRLLDLLDAMAASGLTGGHVMDGAPGTFDILRLAESKRDLGIRLRISPWILPGTTDAELDDVLALQGEHGRRWHVEGVKLFIDGTIDNGTAWLEEPDCYGESTSSVWLDPARYAEILHRCAARGVPTATHAIGDAGLRFAAETIAAAPKHGAAPAVHRIEHIETMPTETIDLFVQAGIAASMQPTHCSHYTRADQTDNWSTRLGPERASRAFRIKSLRDAGVPVALGSDWPIAPFDPLASMADARLRRPAGKPSVPPVRPEQALSAYEALEGYTTQIAAAIGDSAGGRIAVGRPADLTVLARDPLTIEPDELSDTEVVATYIAGIVSYDGSSSDSSSSERSSSQRSA